MKFLVLFRYVSILEGVSLLLLFGIAMPMKYLYHQPTFVEVIGMLHGVLFIGYVLSALFLAKQQKWSLINLTIIIAASVIPFGTFYVDHKYLRNKTT
jgi:integral membrane protein